MTAYVVNELFVTDQALFQTYVVQVPATLAAFGGRYIVRSGTSEAIEGDPPGRLVIIEFPDREAGKAWRASPPTRRSFRSATPPRRRGSTSSKATSPSAPSAA